MIKYYPYKKLEHKKRDSKSLSIEYYKAFRCIFCEKFFQENELSQSIKCEHKFCNKCGEIFFYDLINNSINNNQSFICPLFKCKKEIPYNAIELLLASNNIDTLRNNQNKQDSSESQITKNNILKEKENKCDDNISNYSIKKITNNIYDTRCIIDITKNVDKDYIFGLGSKKKFILCPSCNQIALYTKASKYFLKCLYCSSKFCKFCVKPLVDYHFNSDNIDRCKIFFRKKKQFYNNNIIIKFIKQIFLIIAGYLFLMSFFINKIKELHKSKNNISIFKKITKYFLYSIICILIIPIIIIIIPYYPIISCF